MEVLVVAVLVGGRMIKRAFFKPRSLVLIVGGVMMALALNLQHINSKSNSILMAANGLRVCSKRVSQSFNSKISDEIGAPSLQNGFYDSSNNCLKEVKKISEKSYLTHFTDSMNQIIIDAHWFHQNLGKDKSAEFNEAHGLESESAWEKNYYKVAESSRQALKLLSAERKIASAEARQLSIYFWSATSLMVLITLMLWMKETKRDTALDRLDREASHLELSNKREAVAIAEKAFNRLGLYGLQSAVHGFLHNDEDKRTKKMKQLENEIVSTHEKNKNLVAHLAKDGKELEEQIDEIWAQDIKSDEIKDSPQGICDLDEVLQNTFDTLSGKLFSQAISLDINVPGSQMIVGSLENVEQIFYHTVNFSVDLLKNNNTNGKIVISWYRKGSRGHMHCILSGFNQEIDDCADNTRELQIAKSLAKEVGASLKFERVVNKLTACPTVKMTLDFKVAKSEKRLVRVKKGKKRDIRRQIELS